MPASYRVRDLFISRQREGSRRGDRALFVDLAAEGDPRAALLDPGDLLHFAAGLAAGAALEEPPPLFFCGHEPFEQLEPSLAALALPRWRMIVGTTGLICPSYGLAPEIFERLMIAPPRSAPPTLPIAPWLGDPPGCAFELTYVREEGDPLPRAHLRGATHHWITPPLLEDGALDLEAFAWCLQLALEEKRQRPVPGRWRCSAVASADR